MTQMAMKHGHCIKSKNLSTFWTLDDFHHHIFSPVVYFSSKFKLRKIESLFMRKIESQTQQRLKIGILINRFYMKLLLGTRIKKTQKLFLQKKTSRFQKIIVKINMQFTQSHFQANLSFSKPINKFQIIALNRRILENSLMFKCIQNSRTLHDNIVSLMESNAEVRYELVKEVPYEGPTIAIDLGTSYAYVAVPNNGKALILTHENGSKAYPCYISFTETERLIGSEAKALAAKNPHNTVFDFKRMIGKSFKDPILQEDMKKWPFKVQPDELGRPKIVVTHKGETKKFHPEQLTAMILIRLKQAAEKFLQTTVKKAVITVPAYFRDSQRQATRDAANLAGLSVSRLINEPAAAAVAYGLSSHFPTGEVKLLVYELGAGTFDASVVSIQDGFIQILSTVGDTHLGAEDFDNRLVEVCAEKFHKEAGVDLKSNWEALQNLKAECSKVRRALTTGEEASFKLENLAEGKTFEYKITRNQWEAVCQPILGKTVGLINKVIEDAKLEAKSINQIILAGGATHAPMVTNLVKKLFPGQQPNKSIDPDQAVVLGAALLAQDIAGDSKSKKQKSLLLINVVPISLGIQGPEGAMMVIIPHDTSIPTIRHHTFTTTQDNQQMILVTIYEGQNKLVKDNHILGAFKLTKIPPAPKGTPAIEIMIHVDADGVLELKAVDKDNAKEIDTPVMKWTLSKSELEKLKEGGFYYEETHMPKKPSKMDEVD